MFDTFQSVNDVSLTTTVVLDKDFVSLPVVEKKFPRALVRICQFHAIKFLSSVICDEKYKIPQNIRKKLRPLFRLLARANNEAEYDMYYNTLISLKLTPAFMEYFERNWHDQRKAWVYCWTSFMSVGNTTTNALESFHSSLKKLVDQHAPLDELLRVLLSIVLCIHEEVEHVLLRETTQSTYKSETEEMKRFSEHYTKFACDLISKQLNLSSSNSYDALKHAAGVINLSTRNIRQCCVDSCTCTFFVSYQLPCRHMLFLNAFYFNLTLLNTFLNSYFKIMSSRRSGVAAIAIMLLGAMCSPVVSAQNKLPAVAKLDTDKFAGMVFRR